MEYRGVTDPEREFDVNEILKVNKELLWYTSSCQENSSGFNVCTFNNKQDLTVILVHFPLLIAQIMSSKRCLLKTMKCHFRNTFVDSCHMLYYCLMFNAFTRSLQTSSCLAKESIYIYIYIFVNLFKKIFMNVTKISWCF